MRWVTGLFCLMLFCSGAAQANDDWLAALYVKSPVVDAKLKRVVNTTSRQVFNQFKVEDKNVISTTNAKFHMAARKRLAAVNYFNPQADSELILQYQLAWFGVEEAGGDLLRSLAIQYRLVDDERTVVLNKQVSVTRKQSKYDSEDFESLWLANFDKFLIELRAHYDQKFAQRRESLLKIADDSLISRRSIGSYFTQGGTLFLENAVAPVLVGVGSVVVGVAEVVSDPAFAQGVTQIAHEMQQEQLREQELHRRTIQAIHEENAREQAWAAQNPSRQESSVAEQTEPRSAAVTLAGPKGQAKASDEANAREERLKREAEEKRLAQLQKQEEEKRKKELEAKRKEEERLALEAKRKQERAQYARAVRAGTHVGAIACGASKQVRIVGTQGRATRPEGVYDACKLKQVRYRCMNESQWKYYTNNLWVLNNACIGAGDDVVVQVDCPAERVVVEPVTFSCDSYLQ